MNENNDNTGNNGYAGYTGVPPVAPDPELVRRAMQWDEDAYRAVYENTYYHMLDIARRRIADDTQAANAVQDAFVRIWTNFGTLDRPEHYMAWADGIMDSVAAEHAAALNPAVLGVGGVPGADGISGVDGVPGAGGVGGVPGADGISGVDGVTGAGGVGGVPGADGISGVDGTPGTDGAAGTSGTAGAAGKKAAGSFLKTTGGKIAVAAAGIAVAAGIGIGIWLLTKGGNDSPQEGPVAAASTENVSTETVGTEDGPGTGTEESTAEDPGTEETTGESGTDQAGTTETVSTEETTEPVTEPVTEPATESVTEDPPDYSYAESFLKLLEDNHDAILSYEADPEYYSELKGVALADVVGDETPELFFAAKKDRDKAAELMVYTIRDGEAVSLNFEEEGGQIFNIFTIVAGGYQIDTVYGTKDKTGIYWERTAGDATSTTLIRRFRLDGNTFKGEILDKTVSYFEIETGNGKDEHEQVMSDEEKKNMGEIVISNSSGYGYGNAFLLEDAESYLKALIFSGEGKRGWQKLADRWYYYSPFGWLRTGWLKDGGKWYYLSPTGEMCTGWITDGGKRYYLNGKGEMVTGEVTIDGVKYSFDEEGAMIVDAHAVGDTFLKELKQSLGNDLIYDLNSKYQLFSGAPNMDVRPEAVKYAYMDLNHDGMDELILGGELNAVLSFTEGVPYVAAFADLRSLFQYEVLSDGHLLYKTESGIRMTYTEYILEKDGRTVTELRSAATDDYGEDTQELEKMKQDMAGAAELDYQELHDLR